MSKLQLGELMKAQVHIAGLNDSTNVATEERFIEEITVPPAIEKAIESIREEIKRDPELAAEFTECGTDAFDLTLVVQPEED